MIPNVVEQELELWEAWIEYDPFNPDYFGTLYVLGEVLTNVHDDPRLCRLDANSRDLLLRIPEANGKCRRKEVMYSEPIRHLDQYASIHIYSGQELITCFNEIEVLI